MRPSRLLWCALVYVAESYRFSSSCTCYVQLSTPALFHKVQSAKT